MCGFVGIVLPDGEAVIESLFVGLQGVQHRGKENAGIVTESQGRYCYKSGRGEIVQVFPSKQSLAKFKGAIGLTQTRYATSGGSYDAQNQQPIKGKFHGRTFFMVHNGNIVNIPETNGCTREGCSDSYWVVQRVSHSRKRDFVEAIIEVVSGLRGSFCFVFMFNGKLYVVRDRFGFHPLSIGRIGGGWMVVSETRSLDMVKAEFVRDIQPGELVEIGPDGIVSQYWTNQTCLKFDIFEFIYTMSPDSIAHYVLAGQARQMMGKCLAIERPVDIQMIVPVPDSANEAALGYAFELMRQRPELLENSLPFLQPELFFRGHNVGRTFLEPTFKSREEAQKVKFNTRWPLLKGIKEIGIVDDSLIRSIVMKGRMDDLLALRFKKMYGLVQMFRGLGIRSVHALITSPPYINPDLYGGADTYRKKEQLAMKKFKGNIKAIADDLGLASLNYLSLGGTIHAILEAQAKIGLGHDFYPENFYAGPFDGIYPDGTFTKKPC